MQPARRCREPNFGCRMGVELGGRSFRAGGEFLASNSGAASAFRHRFVAPGGGGILEQHCGGWVDAGRVHLDARSHGGLEERPDMEEVVEI